MTDPTALERQRLLEAPARSILATTRWNYDTTLTVVAAREADFQHLDLRAYANVRDRLAAQGFRHIGDVEIANVTHAPNSLLAPTMIRQMVSTDSQILAGYYQVRPRVGRVLASLARGLLNLRWIAAPRNASQNLNVRHITDFESELSDGTYLVTSNATGAAPIGVPPNHDRVLCDARTPVEDVLAEQRRRLAARLVATPGLTATVITDLEGARQLALRMHEQKKAHRRSIGWITRDELRAMSSNQQLADDLYEVIQRLREEQRGPSC